MDDIRVPIRLAFDAFGVPAVVTRPAPEDVPIDTSIVWVLPLTEDAPGGLELGRREWKRIAAVLRDEVPSVPLRTLIRAPEMLGGPVRRWRVDEVDRIEADHMRVLVVHDPEIAERT